METKTVKLYSLDYSNARTYLMAALFIAGNMALPQLFHLIPQGGITCIIRKSKFPQNPKRSVRFSGKRTKRSVQKRKARNTQKAETKVL